MRIDTPLSAEAASASAATANRAIKDTLGAELITQTLDRLNSKSTLTGTAVDAGYQFRKDVLSSMGLGNKLDLMG